tara:strand:+ start:134 stop:247 length:114 start_codon:yes stop_codon:yes gene_type:complete
MIDMKAKQQLQKENGISYFSFKQTKSALNIIDYIIKN